MTEPRYRAIAADLASQIRSGRYAPGDALPPQRDLSATYGVTLMTLRQALRQLSEDGLIVQKPGSGTYVAPLHLAYQLGALQSLAADLQAQGHRVQTVVLSTMLRHVPARVATQLQLRTGDRGLRLERIRAFAGRRAVHQVSWIRPPHAERIREHDFGEVSLYGALAEAGVVVARATETVRPGVLDAATARHLDEPAGSPVFVSQRVTRTLDDTPVVADRATILGSMMEIRSERTATGLELNWGATSRFANRSA